ncbi:hypothetical protein BDV93DRAFT_507921 [Ceratobasidium sp. AG-I]|nr:hypothetical protein BDV93DRAFT_507921 [Ceratobasidium sp. AG-I]
MCLRCNKHVCLVLSIIPRPRGLVCPAQQLLGVNGHETLVGVPSRLDEINAQTSSFRDNFRHLTDLITDQWDQKALLCTKVNKLTRHIPIQVQPTGFGSASGSLTSPATVEPGNVTSTPGQVLSAQQPTAAFGIKLAKPNKFDGTKCEESAKFKTACHMYLCNVYPNSRDDQKIAFVISFLEGTAHDWLEPYLESDFSGHPIAFLHNENLFWDQFRSCYGLDLKQKGSVQDYLSFFETYSATLGYSDRILKDMFFDCLLVDVINDMIAQDFDVLATNTACCMVIEQALKINKRHQTSTKKSSTSTTTNQYLSSDIESNLTQVPFNTLKIDTRPAPVTLQLVKGSGPGPMELDTSSKGKGPLLCHGCGGCANIIHDCPSRNVLGHEARMEEIDSDDEDNKESLKGNT